MKRQNNASPKILSERLSQFLSTLNNVKFDNHGYNECTKHHSANFVKEQKFHLELENPEIWVATDICQPFLYWNERDELDITGVMDYNATTQTGTLELQTQTGILKIENTHSYFVFANIEGKFLPTNIRYVPEYHELNNIYVAAITQEFDNFTLWIYHNTEVVFRMDDVFECMFYQHRETAKYVNRKGYVRFSKEKGKGLYANYLYDINSETLFNLQESDDMPSCYIPEMNRDFNSVHTKKFWFHYTDDIVRGPWIKVVLHLSESKTSQVVAEFIKNAEQYKVIENIFPDDPTVNIEVLYKSYSKELRFLSYCSEKEPSIFGHGIMGLSLDEVAIGAKNNQDEHHYVYEYSPYHIEQCIYINQHLYERCGEEVALNQLPHKICTNYISSHDMCVFIKKYITHNFKESKIGVFQKEDYTEESKQYNAIAGKIAKSGKLKTRWKNEYALYSVINDKFPDAIYQYHCHWLGYQSLDIYVPSKNIAFEYQGKQHYEAVSYFGGEKALEMQMARDQRKRKLCQDNGVLLIEWRYDEPVSSVVLDRKLKDLL